MLDLGSVPLEELCGLVGANRQPTIELRASAFDQRKAGYEATEREASEIEDEGKSAHILERQVELGRADRPCFSDRSHPASKAIKDAAIDTKYFSYRASYAIKDRTLTVRREFVSKVAGQVCAKEVEAEISEPMQRVLRSLRTQMSF